MQPFANFATKARQSGQCVLTSLVAFLKHPDVATSPATSKPVLIFWLLTFSFGATAIVAIAALPIILTSEVAVGDNLKQVLDRPALSILISLIVLGPLVEEMIFRGWLTGTLRAVCGVAVFLVMFYGAALLMDHFRNPPLGLAVQLSVSALAFAIFTIIERDGAPVRPGFYTGLFPYFFWLQAIVFGSLHFANLGGSSGIVPFLMAASLVVVGLIFAYARIVAGIGAAWLLHALYNLPSAMAAVLLPVLFGW